MKERLLQLLDLEHLTPSKFADLIGVQRSSVSHILSDRNKPSFDFLQKTLKTFPGLKAEWLMLGEGHMYEQMGREIGDLFDSTEPSIGEPEISKSGPEPVGPDLPDIPEVPENMQISQSESYISKRIVQVMLFYDDDTFSTYKPSQ